MRTLQERLKFAMAGPPKVSQAALARACGISAPSVNDWLSGKTKSIEGRNLLLAADFLRVLPKWLATGKGPMREAGEGEPSTPPSVDSDTTRPTSDVLLVEGSRDAEILEAVTALHVIQTTILTGRATRSQINRIMAVRHEMLHRVPIEEDLVPIPSHLQGLVEAAFQNAENGEGPDDLVSMVKHGMSKNRKKEAAQDGESSSIKRAK